MKKITISGYGFEYIRGYVDGAENMSSTDLMEFGESISVSSIRSCNDGSETGFITSYSSFSVENSNDSLWLADAPDMEVFKGSAFVDMGFAIKEQIFLDDLSREKHDKYNYEIFVDGKGAIGEFEIDDDAVLESIILVVYNDAADLNENIPDQMLIGIIPFSDISEKEIFMAVYQAVCEQDPEIFKPSVEGKYKGMDFNEVFLLMQKKYIPIDYSNCDISGSINRL